MAIDGNVITIYKSKTELNTVVLLYNRYLTQYSKKPLSSQDCFASRWNIKDCQCNQTGCS